MSVEHPAAPPADGTVSSTPAGLPFPPQSAITPDDELAYWHGLIPEEAAADFIDSTPRYLQQKRQQGGGPQFVRLSSRFIKYRRLDLRKWIEARLRSSTSDMGETA